KENTDGNKLTTEKVREYWWYANRATIWEAITCKAPDNAQYFRGTCGSGTGTQGRCRCDKEKGANIVPTYFDYVPQFLRWFEEWAEDFCRKRKHKLKDAIDKCRGKNGNDRYCDLNRHDCVETIRGDEHFVEGDHCKDCHYSCFDFVKWIDKQKVEFDKQKRKYTSEISDGDSGRRRSRKKRSSSSSSSDDNGYEKKFYNILKSKGDYQNVETFLKKLNDESICQKPPTVGTKKAHAADFTEQKMLETFSHTEYCQACPWCGAQKKSNGGWEPKEQECGKKKYYDPQNITDITILTPEEGQSDILKKYKKFCKNGGNGATGTVNGGENGKKGDQMEKWKCYYDENKNNNDSSGAINFCVLQDGNQGKPQEKSMHYNSFFWKWVYHMLHDSLDWRKQLGNCINDAKLQNCKNNKCNRECGCFLKWVKQKQTEWEEIEKHFRKQKDIPERWTHDDFLQTLLDKDLLLEIIEGTYGDAKETEHIKKLLDETAVAGASSGKDNTTIDKILQHEGDDAKECQQKCQETQKPPAEESPGARSGPSQTSPVVPSPDTTVGDADSSSEDTSHEESEDSEEEDDDNDGGDHDGDQDAAKPETEEAEGDSVPEEGKGPQGSPPKVEVDNKLDVCETVATALTGSLKEACEQKYQYGKERFPNWKCIPSGDKTATSGGESGETTARGPSRQRRNADPAKASGTNQGSICVPPRRRKLYVGHLEKWAKTSGSNTQARGSEPQASESSQGTTKAKSPQGGVESQGQTPSQSDNKLLEAFIQSAAIETFFAWYEFKKEKEKEEKEKAQLVVNTSSVEENLQNQLKKGEIPEEFKRQMFYTFGDYRDIFFGKDVGGDMDTVNQKITALFKKNGQSIEEQLKQWWKTYGENIWEGMVCALSYNTDTKQMNKDIKTNLTSLEKNNNYTNVTFPSESGSGSGTKLLEFSKTPQFVRWFEEWGEEFCRIRNHKLQKVKKECRGENIGDKYCDGDGYDCTDKDKLRNKSFIYLQCSGCQKECIKYKKWIVNKRNEFNKQKKKFENEIKTVNGTNEDKYDEEVYKNPKLMYPTFQKFVPRLNECPYCINSKVGGQIDFKKNGETFGSSEYCKACPVYGVKYIRGQYQRINKNALNTEIDNNPTEIDVVILDRKGYDKDNDLDKACMNTGLFENSSFQKWICQYLNKTDQCKLTNFSGDIDDDTEMEFNVFFQQWLRYFVQDYNKLKDKVNACIKNHDEKSNKCIKGCKDKCDCVEKWLKIKKTEWDNVKEHFKKRKSIYDYDIPYWVKSFFKREPFESDYQKSQEVVEDPNKRDELWGCTGENIEDGEKPENCDKGDFITQLIDKLKKKIAQCKEKHIETTDKPCNETLPELPFLTPDEPLDDYYIQQPKICPPPMTCVEKIAKELREEAEKSLDNIDSSLKVDRTIFTKDCNKVIKQNGAPNGDACDFEKTYKTSLDSLKEPCKGKEKERFNIGNIWNCKYINKIRKDICIPPRKKYMCIQNFKNITTRDVTNSTQLLQKLQEVAQNEGDDIIKSLLPENSCNEYVICDAMKYSFADIGDIIRGRDLWNNNIKPGIQTRLEYIFGNIYKSLKGENEKKYKDDFPLYYKLRSDWWDANRKEVWKAMTCNAPKDAHLKKKNIK
ncbi:hypothetical protein PFTANZ_03632, partial [Plasmodium falciparum Tanzania (2000708)]